MNDLPFRGTWDHLRCLVCLVVYTLPGHLRSPPMFSAFGVAHSLDFWVVFCRSLFVPLCLFFWRVHCPSFWRVYYCPSFDLRLLITPLVSSNISETTTTKNWTSETKRNKSLELLNIEYTLKARQWCLSQSIKRWFCPSVHFNLAIALSVLLLMASDYSFGIFKHFWDHNSINILS